LAFSSDNIGKTPEPKRKSPVTVTTKEKTDTKVNTKVDIKSIGVKQPPKVEVKPISKMATIDKVPTKSVSTGKQKFLALQYPFFVVVSVLQPLNLPVECLVV
jgi:hypothetical protein